MSHPNSARPPARRCSRFLAVCSLAALCACGTAPSKGPLMILQPPAEYLLPPERPVPLIPNCTAADDEDACIPPEQLLENHVLNAEACFNTREQLQRLIDWHRQAAP